MFSVSFLERMLALKDALPFHIARKKVPYIDETGELVDPNGPNALKFERFIFDLLPHAKNPLVVEFAEADVFAPLKNAPGAPRDTRIVKDMYPPRIELEFKLVRADGSVEKEGSRKLRDSAFLWGASPASQEAMRYEKGLIDAWLQKEFAPAKAASANR